MIGESPDWKEIDIDVEHKCGHRMTRVLRIFLGAEHVCEYERIFTSRVKNSVCMDCKIEAKKKEIDQ